MSDLDPKVIRLINAVKAMREKMFINDYLDDVLDKHDTHLSDEVDTALEALENK